MSSSTSEIVSTIEVAFEIDESVSLIDQFESNSIGLNYGLITFQIKPYSETIPHEHNSYEVWYVQEGNGIAIINNSEVKLRKGLLIKVEFATIHSIKNENDKPLSILSLWWRDSE